MADSEAVRSRRKRLHAAGDHSVCRRCAAVRGDVAQDVAARVTALPAPPPGDPAPKLDPRAEMEQLALRLVAAHEGDPRNTLLARELRMTLHELLPKGNGNADADLKGLFDALQA